jgi:DNA-binding MurR/RpiR family transcriptional regulator
LPEELFERIRAQRGQMSPGFRRVADYLAEHYKDAAFEPAAAVAAAANVSESLVVRFAASLGYEGYPGLTRELRGMVKARLSLPERLRRAPQELTGESPMAQVFEAVIEQDRSNLAGALGDTSSSSLDDVLGAMLAARKIFLVGLRGSAHLAGLFGLLLDKAGADVVVISQGDVLLFDTLRRVGAQDLVFTFTFARYTRRSVDALRLARSRGAITVLMTDSVSAPVAGEADHSLHVPVGSASFHHSYVAALSLMNALVVGWTLRAPERTVRSLEAIEELLPQEEFLS